MSTPPQIAAKRQRVTPYSETEALIRAMEDYDTDTDNIDQTIDYLIEQFLPGELRRLAGACSLLMTACREASSEVARRAK